MVFLREVIYLFKKELMLEWRQKYTISGILLYVSATIFIVYMAAPRVTPANWNVLFWIIALFAAVNAVLKSFVHEGGNRQLYFYQLASPLSVIVAKIAYNFLLLLFILLLSFTLFSFFTENPVKENGLFFIILLLASLGFSLIFTFISAISGKTGSNATLLAILGFPVVIPTLSVLIKLSANALRLMTDTTYNKDLIILVCMDLILVVVVSILFPYLWRD
jgi:heme exporter protein B